MIIAHNSSSFGMDCHYQSNRKMNDDSLMIRFEFKIGTGSRIQRLINQYYSKYSTCL